MADEDDGDDEGRGIEIILESTPEGLCGQFRECAEQFARASQSPDGLVRLAGIQVLVEFYEKIRGAGRAEELLPLLEDASALVRLVVATRLIDTVPEAAVPVLKSLAATAPPHIKKVIRATLQLYGRAPRVLH